MILVRKRTLRSLNNKLSQLQGVAVLTCESVINDYLTYPSSQPAILMLETACAPTAGFCGASETLSEI